GESYPLVAISRGGNLRDIGSLDGNTVGSTNNGDILEVLRPVDSYYQDFRWFEVSIDGITAYQWGGILCSPLEPVLGMRDCVE
ncbi:hypothetical protein OAS86_03825, partial [Gammaproteobacteria bacterium]|nr:hypothetical protein [Gammaproteobacteria bacterium]